VRLDTRWRGRGRGGDGSVKLCGVVEAICAAWAECLPLCQSGHASELYLAVEDIDHTRIKARSPQTNGICERFHRTLLDEFYRVAFRKHLYDSIAQLQADLDNWVRTYNTERPHQGRWCFGKTPMQTFVDILPIAQEKLLPAA
jgi:hypothetical protein